MLLSPGFCWPSFRCGVEPLLCAPALPWEQRAPNAPVWELLVCSLGLWLCCWGLRCFGTKVPRQLACKTEGPAPQYQPLYGSSPGHTHRSGNWVRLAAAEPQPSHKLAWAPHPPATAQPYLEPQPAGSHQYIARTLNNCFRHAIVSHKEMVEHCIRHHSFLTASMPHTARYWS